MAEQAVLRIKRITVPIPVLSLSAIRSRLWMVGPPLVLAALGVLLGTHIQKSTLRAESHVYFSVSNPALPTPRDPRLLIAQESPARFLTTQATIARRPELARRVVAAAGVPGLTPSEFLRRSSAKPHPDSEVLDLAVSYPKAAAAVRIANAYASEFTRYKTELDVAQINKALRAMLAKIHALRDRGLTESPAYRALVLKRIDLETMGQLIANEAKVLEPASRATSVRAHAVRNGILGGLIGAMLGLVLVAAVTKLRPQAR
jgi:hypothetical protein